MADAERKIALVTGANKGIGLAVVGQLADQGYTVLLGARDAARGQEAVASLKRQDKAVRFQQIDITDAASVSRAAADIERDFGRLDVLVNNAGVKLEWHPAPPSQCTIDMVRQTYETNVFGTMSVILAMLPLLRRSAAGRIVNVSSGLGSIALARTAGTPFNLKPMLSYSTSKSAVNAMTVQFANELRDTPIKVNAADPGYTSTDMTCHDGARTPEMAARPILRLATLPADGPSGGFFDESGVVPW
jgi:NAD(P)-dependent dehydrogenase (short-subunit alcohol dehydrogenase family)